MTEAVAALPAIGQIVAPVIMISASGLMASTMYGRLSAIIGRLRDMQRARLTEIERFAKMPEEERDTTITATEKLWLEDLCKQIPMLLIRASILTAVVVALLVCVGCQVCCSLVLAFEVMFPLLGLGERVPIVLFIIGAICMLLAAMLCVPELFLGLRPMYTQQDVINKVQYIEIGWLVTPPFLRPDIEKIGLVTQRRTSVSMDAARMSLVL